MLMIGILALVMQADAATPPGPPKSVGCTVTGLPLSRATMNVVATCGSQGLGLGIADRFASASVAALGSTLVTTWTKTQRHIYVLSQTADGRYQVDEITRKVTSLAGLGPDAELPASVIISTKELTVEQTLALNSNLLEREISTSVVSIDLSEFAARARLKTMQNRPAPSTDNVQN